MPAAMTTATRIREQLEYAPRDGGRTAPGLLGWWTPDGYYVCAPCAGRLIARGCALPRDSESVWKETASPVGVCVGCQS